MIEGLLYSALGFLVALGLAVAIAPSLWRRAEYLERRRIEAALPLSREELEAAVDAIRAESAMAIRKLEVRAEQLRRKSAEDLVELNVLRDRIRDLEEECANRDRTISRLEHEQKQLEGRLATKDEQLRDQSARVAELAAQLTEQMNRVQQLSRLNDELNMIVSTQKIDLAARDAEIDRLNNTNRLLRNERRDADRTARELEREKSKLENALRHEKSRAEDLQARLDRLLHDLSDRDQILERQERELAQLGHPGVAAAFLVDLGPINGEPALPNGEQALSNGKDVTVGQREVGDMTGEEDEVARLRRRIAALTSSARGRRKADTSSVEHLREEISSIAAEMVRMVADREGPGSAVETALSAPLPDGPTGQGSTRPESLAERVEKMRSAS